ncbi:MAG: hypothetical protein V1823_01390 [Chloroflexota bacterium]
MANDEKAKLRSLLGYWLEHNQAHRQEFQEWATKARAMGEATASEAMLTAAREMEPVNRALSRALKSLVKEEN